MNIYIGNSVNEIDLQDINVEFGDELLDFIYKLCKQVPLDMSKLCGINPYDDIEVSKNDLPSIIEVCNYILGASLLQNYEESEEGNQTLRDLVEIAKVAMSKDMGLVSIGD